MTPNDSEQRGVTAPASLMNPRGGKREFTPESCPLTSVHTARKKRREKKEGKENIIKNNFEYK